MKCKKQLKKTGFTIVELIVVIAVIGILASIAYVWYGSAPDRARAAAVRSDLLVAAELLNTDMVRSGGRSFPANLASVDGGNGVPASEGTTYLYTVNNIVSPPTFCLRGTNDTIVLHIREDGEVKEGACS